MEGAADSPAAAAAEAAETAALLLPLPKGRPLLAAGVAEPPVAPPCLCCSLFCISLFLGLTRLKWVFSFWSNRDFVFGPDTL